MGAKYTLIKEHLPRTLLGRDWLEEYVSLTNSAKKTWGQEKMNMVKRGGRRLGLAVVWTILSAARIQAEQVTILVCVWGSGGGGRFLGREEGRSGEGKEKERGEGESGGRV